MQNPASTRPSSLVAEKAADQEVTCSGHVIEALTEIDSVFGRLVYLSSRWNEESGTYWDGKLSQRFQSYEIDQAIRKHHFQVMAEWLSMGLEQQKADLTRYVSESGTETPSMLLERIRKGSYCFFLPRNATDVEERLFLSDLEILVALNRHKTI